MTSRLPIEEDLRFERAEWRFASTLWYVLLAMMAAILLGVFGNGPLSSAEAGIAGSPLRIEYERFGRLGAAMRTTVHLVPGGDGSTWFTVSRAYLEAIRVVAITPEPSSATVTGDSVRYEFVHEGSPAVVMLDFEPRRVWRVRGRIAHGGAEHAISHFIYP